MAEPITPNAIRITLRWLNGQLPMVNTLGINAGAVGIVDVSTANLVAGVITNAFSSSGWNNFVDSGTSLQSVTLRDLRIPNAPEVFASPFSPVSGLGAGERVSTAAAAVVTLRTAKAGKRFRGRVFLGGITSTAVDDETGQISSPAYSAAVAFIETIRTGLLAQPGQPFTLAVISQSDDEAVPPWPGETNTVTIVVGRSAIVGTQRRRLPERP